MVAYDVETTGLDGDTDEIIEVAANKFTFVPDEKQNFLTVEIGRYQSLVKPKGEISAFITSINHIDNDMVKDAPELRPVLVDFLRFCGGASILVAHNASFDTEFIGRGIRRNAIPMAMNPIFDSLKLVKKIMPELRSYKLVEIAKRLHGQTVVSLETNRLHRAEYDCIILREICCACFRKRYQCSDLLQQSAMKNLIKIHGKPLFFPDFA